MSVLVPAALEDEIASVLGGGSLGVEVAAAGPGRSVVRVYLGAADDTDAWRARAERILAGHGLSAAESPVTVTPVADERWVERWQAALAPLPIGKRFVVLPGDGVVAPPGREPIRLVPGMAFGTGAHPTTRMCAEALERLVRPGERWLDLGTGTGILALVAARCGATRVLAVDLDPEAARVAIEVVAANGAANTVEVRTGSLDAAASEKFDGIVANVQSSFFLGEAGGLAAGTVPGGALIVSGVLEEDLEEIVPRLRAHGLEDEAVAIEAPWACLTARRAP